MANVPIYGINQQRVNNAISSLGGGAAPNYTVQYAPASSAPSGITQKDISGVMNSLNSSSEQPSWNNLLAGFQSVPPGQNTNVGQQNILGDVLGGTVGYGIVPTQETINAAQNGDLKSRLALSINNRNINGTPQSWWEQAVDGVMMDLGVSSPQFDDPTRGFSYRYDARLDMRMDKSQSLDAWQVVNTYEYSALVRILQQYGEERYAKQIARAIERKRKEHSIDTTFELVDVIRSALPERVLHGKGHPAKQTFQALRIEVNDELGALQRGLEEACSLLKSGGRCAVITFHSLEDRMVKTAFRNLSSAPFVEPKLPVKQSQMEQASFLLVTRKPVVADEGELEENHRAHSAKLRVIEKK